MLYLEKESLRVNFGESRKSTRSLVEPLSQISFKMIMIICANSYSRNHRNPPSRKIIYPVGKIAKKQSEGVRILLFRHSKYSAKFSKIHSYRLLFQNTLLQTAFSAVDKCMSIGKKRLELWEAGELVQLFDKASTFKAAVLNQ